MSSGSGGKMLRKARARADDLLGVDGLEALRSIGNDLKNAGAQVMQVAQEVSEDCDNEVLSNARAFYSDAYAKTKRGVRASIQRAEALSEEDDAPVTVREDLADTGMQLRQVAREVIEDCDNDTLKTAREFYSGAAGTVREEVRQKAEKARIRAERRKQVRAAARRRRAALRQKVGGKAAVVMICLILAAVLLISGAFWVSHHFGGRNENQQVNETTETAPQKDAEPSLLFVSDGYGRWEMCFDRRG